MTLRRILLIIIGIGLCYLGWQRLRPFVIKMVCESNYNEALTTASQMPGTAVKAEAIRNEADAAYQTCLHDWGLETNSPPQE